MIHLIGSCGNCGSVLHPESLCIHGRGTDRLTPSNAANKRIYWSKQHCGVHQAPLEAVIDLMPDLANIMTTFPEDAADFTWDVKVHMLMPRMYPCIPGWHVDNVPREESGPQQFDRVSLDAPMWMWISGGPLTQFRTGYVLPEKWHRFTQADEHRGTAAAEFSWRGFIRGTHKSIMKPKTGDWLRRHSQVYVDEVDYQW